VLETLDPTEDLPMMNFGGDTPTPGEEPVEMSEDDPAIYQSGVGPIADIDQPEIKGVNNPAFANNHPSLGGGHDESANPLKKRKRGVKPSLFGSNSPLREWMQKTF
jgi:hypothetical protein